MTTYKIKWSDGEAAASRGGDIDHAVYSEVIAKDDKEALTIAYIERALCTIFDEAPINGLEDENLFDEAMVYGYEEDEYDELKYNTEDPESELDQINMDGIDGGEPWIIWIKDNAGNIIYDNTDADIPDPYSVIEDLPNELTIKKEDWEAAQEDSDYADIPFEDIESDGLSIIAQDVISNTKEFEDLNSQLQIYDCGDWVGSIYPETFDAEIKPNGDIYISNIDWEVAI